jgi:hypothetical protein
VFINSASSGVPEYTAESRCTRRDFVGNSWYSPVKGNSSARDTQG